MHKQIAELFTAGRVYQTKEAPPRKPDMGNLIYYGIVLLVVAVVAAFLGFGGVAGTAMDGARILFWVAIILAAIAFVAGLVRRS